MDLGKLQDEAEKKAAEEAAEAFKPILEKLKEVLKDKAQDVRITTRLVDSPACLVVTDSGMSPVARAAAESAGVCRGGSNSFSGILNASAIHFSPTMPSARCAMYSPILGANLAPSALPPAPMSVFDHCGCQSTMKLLLDVDS